MNRPRALSSWLVLLLCGVSLCRIPTRSAQAQANTGSILGYAADPAGRPIQGAIIVVRNTDLGTKRVANSDEHGAFRIDGLVPGAFTVEGTASGMLTRRPVRLTLALGSTVQVKLALSVASVAQKTTVTARPATSEGNTVAPEVNKQEASVGSFFPGMTVTYLPNRDRDFTQFGQLGEGVSEAPEGAGVVVAGQRTAATVTQVDGANFNDPLHGGRRGAGDGSFFLPQTVVREFQIVRSGIGAQTGGTNAGLVNVVTKEGSNKLHGEAFYTVRPSWTGSADAFGHKLENRQNTFGVSLGGPVRRNRLFYYVGVEQDLLRSPFYTQFEPQAQAVVVPTLLAALEGQVLRGSTPTALFGRTDAVLGPANTLNVELAGNRVRGSNIDDGSGGNSSRSVASAAHTGNLSGQSLWARAGLTTLVNERSVNEALISWSNDHRNRTPLSTTPELSINGFGTLGGDSLGPWLQTSEQLQLGDTLTISRGSASLHLGGGWTNSPAYEQREANLNGRFDYNSLADYVANTPRRFQQTLVTGDPRYRGTVRTADLFASIQMPLGRQATLTAGVRWDGQWNPQPPHPNAAVTQTQRIADDLSQWQPRLGLAWTPARRTVVRLSAGVYGSHTPATLFHRVSADSGLQTVVADSYFDPQLLPLVSGRLALGAPPIGLTTPKALVAGIDPRFRNPRSLQAAAGVEQEVAPKLTLSAGYLHNSTWRLERRVDRNLAAPVSTAAGLPVFPAARPNPTIGRLLVEESSAHADYDGLLLSAVSAISRRSQLTIHYTLSRTRDDDSNTGPYGIDAALDPYNLAAERAFSSLDVRHVLNVGAIFNLPLGLKCNPLFVTRSGRPYTPLIGFDTQRDANDWNDRALVGGTTAGRNSLRQPAFSNLDLRLVKDFTLHGAGHHLDLFMDVFNLVGARNREFGGEGASLYGTAATPVASAGQALFAPDATRIGGPRTIQFTARLVAF